MLNKMIGAVAKKKKRRKLCINQRVKEGEDGNWMTMKGEDLDVIIPEKSRIGEFSILNYLFKEFLLDSTNLSI